MLAPMNVSDLSLGGDSPGINSNGSLQDLMNIYNNLCMKLQENHHKLDIRMQSVLNLGMYRYSYYAKIIELIGITPMSQRQIYENIGKDKITLQGVAKHLREGVKNCTIAYLGNKVNNNTSEAKLQCYDWRRKFISGLS